MNMYDAITGTIIQITGIIPCLAVEYSIIAHHRKQVNNGIDSHVYIVRDGYGSTFRVVFRVILDNNGKITRFIPIFARVV